MKEEVTVFWFRRDLRLSDNHGLFKALESSENVLPIFIFDTEILSRLENRQDKRLDFLVQVLNILNEFLEKSGKSIKILHGTPLQIFKDLTDEYRIAKMFTNEDYEPAAIKRDTAIKNFLKTKNIGFELFKDQVHFHKEDILKNDGTPYTIYTPYSKQWLRKYDEEKSTNYPSEKLLHRFINLINRRITLEEIGFQESDYAFEIPVVDAQLIKTYHETRNFPASKTSEMSVHLRFGTISVRKLASETANLNPTYLKELIWREFFMQILYYFPKVVHQSFKKKIRSDFMALR